VKESEATKQINCQDMVDGLTASAFSVQFHSHTTRQSPRVFVYLVCFLCVRLSRTKGGFVPYFLRLSLEPCIPQVSTLSGHSGRTTNPEIALPTNLPHPAKW
jgi:hypothetical protein